MTYSPKTWTDESGSARYEIIDGDGSIIAESAVIEPATARTPGTVITAARMNNIEQGIAALPVTAPIFNPVTWDGLPATIYPALTVGNTVYNVHSEVPSIPESARAVLVLLTAAWSVGANNSNYVNVFPRGTESRCVIVREVVSGRYIEKFGVVPLNNDGEIEVRINGAAVISVDIAIYGYIP